VNQLRGEYHGIKANQIQYNQNVGKKIIQTKMESLVNLSKKVTFLIIKDHFTKNRVMCAAKSLKLTTIN